MEKMYDLILSGARMNEDWNAPVLCSEQKVRELAEGLLFDNVAADVVTIREEETGVIVDEIYKLSLAK